MVDVRVHGQAQHFVGGLLCVREALGGQRRAGIDRLLVQAHGIVHGSGHAIGLEHLDDLGTVGHAHGVLGVDARVALSHRYGADLRVGGVGQQAGIAGAGFGAQLHVLVEVIKLDQQHGGLQGVQAAVDADGRVHVALGLAMQANLGHLAAQLVVVGEAGAAVTVAAQRLAGEEAGAADGGQAARALAVTGGAKALGAVLDDRQAMAGSNGVDGFHVGALAVQADRDDGAGARRDGRFQQAGVQVAGVGVDVDEDRCGAQQADGLGRGDEGERGGDDFVTRADAQGHHGHLQCRGAVADADGMAHAHVFGQALFQLGHFRPHDVLAMVEHGLHPLVNGGFQAAVLLLEVDEIDVLQGGEHDGFFLRLGLAPCWRPGAVPGLRRGTVVTGLEIRPRAEWARRRVA